MTGPDVEYRVTWARATSPAIRVTCPTLDEAVRVAARAITCTTAQTPLVEQPVIEEHSFGPWVEVDAREAVDVAVGRIYTGAR